MAVTLLITDQDLNVVGDPLDGWSGLKTTRNDNAPDSGSVTLPAWPHVLDQLQLGNRMVVIRDGAIWAAGPMEIPQDWEEGLGGEDGGQDAPPPGEVEVNFTSDDASVHGRLTYPNPALAASSASQPAAYTATGINAETLLRTLVDLNAGPGALPARRIPQLVLGAAAGVGTTTSLTTRFEELGQVLRSVALAGGDLAFGTHQVGDQIVWSVRARRDLTGTARFSRGLGNLRYVRYKLSAPTATTAIVGGTGEGEARTVVEVTDAAAEATGRVEKFVDKSGVADDSTGELTQAGQEALASGAAPVELSTVTVDIPDRPGEPGLIAGRDFAVGDLVTVELRSGIEVAEYVRSDTLTADPDSGERVVSVIGSADATTDRRLVQVVRELAARLARLEAR